MEKSSRLILCYSKNMCIDFYQFFSFHVLEPALEIQLDLWDQHL
jgi:hypothetical protein